MGEKQISVPETGRPECHSSPLVDNFCLSMIRARSFRLSSFSRVTCRNNFAHTFRGFEAQSFIRKLHLRPLRKPTPAGGNGSIIAKFSWELIFWMPRVKTTTVETTARLSAGMVKSYLIWGCPRLVIPGLARRRDTCSGDCRKTFHFALQPAGARSGAGGYRVALKQHAQRL